MSVIGDEEEPTPSFRYTWDVFLSFRGEDTRETVTADIHDALKQHGIRTFRDSEGLKQGDEIDPGLLEAIQDSAIAVAVISKRYADSRWCLEELVRILECRRLVLPVFYGVEPSEVRSQKGEFGDGFGFLRERFGEESKEVVRWKNAMQKVGGLSGYVCRDRNEHGIDKKEEEIIKSIVKRILKTMSNTPMGVAKYPVGLESRVEELMRMLKTNVCGVRVLGFHGAGGIGKTTLAKAVYNKLVVAFKHRSFISNIRETAQKNNGLQYLQKKMISDLSTGRVSMTDEDVLKRITSIKRITQENPVLIVLDDVDDVSQLESLAGGRDWFSEGTRIIVTSRNKQVLEESIVNEFYEVKTLSSDESLRLFSFHAFGRDKPLKDFTKLSDEIIFRMGGLPLGLEVIGSYLYHKRTENEWTGVLLKLGSDCMGELHNVLKISYDGLDEQEKSMFLDIACFFVQMRMKREDVIDIFKACGFSAEIGITTLTTKSLIKFMEGDVLWMHDQLRDMGRQIVRRESDMDPGKHSRLWDQDEILTVLRAGKGTRNIQGVVLDFEKKNELNTDIKSELKSGFGTFMTYLMGICHQFIHRNGEANEETSMICTRSFEPMVVLRLLQINRVRLYGNFEFIPTGLKWLQWKGCPLTSLPSDYRPRELAVLDLSESKITQVWSWKWWDLFKKKKAEKLQVMDLHDCSNLIALPDLSHHKFIEKLNLENCRSLVKIHKSLGDLTSLFHLNLKDCSSLEEFPNDVSGLKNLQTLILSGCLKLKELPEDIGSMKSLRKLSIDGTSTKNIPSTIFRLTKLEEFSLKNCRSLKSLPPCIGKLVSLRELTLDSSALEELPHSIRCLTSLEELSLMHCRSLTVLPDSIVDLVSLTKLLLYNSAIMELPACIGNLSNLKVLSVGSCQELTKLPDSIEGLSFLVVLHLDGTPLAEIPDKIGALGMLKKLDMRNCNSITSLPESIGKLLSLTTLLLDNSGISELPESFGNLERLETLRMNGCKNLQTLPASFGNLKSLRHLFVEKTDLKELPDNFGMLSNLMTLKMAKEPSHKESQNQDECPKTVALPLSFSNLSLLKELDAQSWDLSGKIPDDFQLLSSLRLLNLSRNKFRSLPSSLKGLSVLTELSLNHCKELKSLPSLPSSLIELKLANCTALESISDLSTLENLWDLHLTNCSKVVDIAGLQRLQSLRRLYMGGCNACFPAVKKRLTKVALRHLRYLSVPANEIPKWFIKEVPSFSARRHLDLKAVIIGVVISLDQQKNDTYREKLPAVVDVQAQILRLSDPKPIYTTTLQLYGVPDTSEDQLFLCRFMETTSLVLMLNEGDKIRIATREKPYFDGLQVKKYGIHLVFENDDDIQGNEDILDESQWSVSERLAKFFASL